MWLVNTQDTTILQSALLDIIYIQKMYMDLP